MAFGHHFDVQVAGIGGGAADGVVQVQFFHIAFAGKLAQPAQRHLDIARAEFLAVVVVAVGALVPDLDRALIAVALLSDANTLRVLAIGAKR